MAAVKRFFSSPRFAVAGASNDAHKFGYKILAWYHQHSLPVTPLNPRAAQITLPSRAYDTVPSPAALPSPKQTSLSVVTPPAVTLQVLQEAHSVGIPAVWLQPGTFDDAVLDFAHSHFEAVIAGDGGQGGEGWCVLVDGDEGLESAGVQWTSQRLFLLSVFIFFSLISIPSNMHAIFKAPAKLDLSNASQLFQIPAESLYSLSVPRKRPRRNTEKLSSQFDDFTPMISGLRSMSGNDFTSAELDYRPNRYRESFLPPSFDSDDDSTQADSGSRKRTRRDSCIVSPSADGPSLSTPTGWGRSVIKAVGKVLDLCWTGAFRGFYAGGGQGYDMPTASVPQEPSWQSSPSPSEKEPYSNTYFSTPVPGQYPDDDVDRTWVVVAPEPSDPFVGTDLPSPSLRSRRSYQASSPRRRSAVMPRHAKKLSFSGARSPTKSQELPSPRSKDSPMSADMQKQAAKMRRKEREEDASIQRLNKQLQAMIREGKEALGTTVEVDDYDMYDSD
ncbi:unnamed protein product [Penicillium salamii]|uniref:CoA-binding domain-containing protein n=1 Tax=Penicillium salamii TaxID=1612424 RepID=A0A9W4NML1_9EURO|nr:unnamed protein product [Penicillium salamii]CAG8119423.1 unnamed protein product [Penicillium salamii]CAG8132679.1 unnamed protein product [Penicillium salamii]CAG8220181.1 unnamed protein product [Penicillium salamii]CAG8299209.1 unnamed protein product [Penicillium salamii]